MHTSSEVVSFAKELESQSAMFYKDLSQKYTADKDIFLNFARENERNIVQIERAYYSVITDAIEACFAFNIEPSKYKLRTDIPENPSQSDILERARDIEESVINFYSDAAEQSKDLMADIPRAFMTAADKRSKRKQKLSCLSED